MRQVPFGPVRFDVMQLKRKDRKTLETIEDIQEELDNTLIEASGNPITISGASNTNAEGLTVTLSPTQAGTGDPSPDNVRAISGVSTLKVYRTGINICEETWETGYLDGSTGAETSESTSIRSVNFNPCSPNTTYYGFDASTASGTYIYWYDESQTYISRVSIYRGVAVTSPVNARFFKVTAYHGGTTYGNNISINYPATDRSYHAYQETTVSLSLGSTIYGGSVNSSTGVLTKELGIADFDDLEWTLDNNGRFRALISDALLANTWTGILCMSNMYKTAAVSSDSTEDLICGIFQQYFYVKNSNYTDVETFKTAMSGAKVVYDLATPTTTQLTAKQLRLLTGDNTIWSNGDTLSFSYQPDNLIGDLKAWVLNQLS